MIVSKLPEALKFEYLSVRNPEDLDQLQLDRHPLGRVLLQLKEMFLDLTEVHFNPWLAPLHDKVGVDVDREFSVVDLEDFKVVKSNLNLKIGQ